MQSGDSRGKTSSLVVWDHTNRAVTILFHSLDHAFLASLSDRYWRSARRDALVEGALYRGWEWSGVSDALRTLPSGLQSEIALCWNLQGAAQRLYRLRQREHIERLREAFESAVDLIG